MSNTYLDNLKQPDQTVNPLFNYLGIRVIEISKENAILDLTMKPEFIQGAGVVAGGIISTLADEAMAHVVIANLAENEDTATIEMNLRFLKAIVEGEIRAVAKLVKKGRNIFAVTADISNKSNQLIAHAGASFMVLDKR